MYVASSNSNLVFFKTVGCANPGGERNFAGSNS